MRVDNTGPIGALIGSLYVHDTKIGTPFDVPLRDSGAARSSTGSYPWRIDGDYETRASITNAGTVTAQFVARIAYDGDGELVFGPRELAPGASATFDLRALRDQGTKDAKGRALPPGAERGRFIWTILTSGQSARLVGRAEVTSTKLGVSSSYSCGQCCPDSWLFSTISPYQQSMSVGSSAAYTIVGYWENCYHQQWSMNISPYGWNVNAPSVASLASQYPGGRATGQGDGTTDFAGWWGVERWEPYIEDCVVDSWSWEQPGAAQVFSVAQSPTRIEMSTGDTNVTISSLVSPSTSVQRTFTTNLVFNDYSSCSAGISIGSVTGSGTQSHGITPSNAGCSGKFTATAHAGGGSTPSGNTTDVFIPPQRLIQMMRGEANAYSEVTQFSVGRVAKNRIGRLRLRKSFYVASCD